MEKEMVVILSAEEARKLAEEIGKEDSQEILKKIEKEIKLAVFSAKKECLVKGEITGCIKNLLEWKGYSVSFKSPCPPCHSRDEGVTEIGWF